MKNKKNKPTKAWQLGLDFLVGQDGNVYFLECNSSSAIVLCGIKKGKMHFDEDIDGIENYEWSIDLYCDYLIKFLKSINVNNIKYRFIFDKELINSLDKRLSENNISISATGIPIFCEKDYITKENTDYWCVDKTNLQRDMNHFIPAGITPIGKKGKYDKNSVFPNFLIKPTNLQQGKGIVFYKQEEIVEKLNFLTQEFMVAKSVNSSLNYINGELIEKQHSPRLCDYRSKIIIDDLGNVGYVGTHRRTSCIDIPDNLSSGEINEKHPQYHTYLCNASANAVRTLLLEKEQKFWEDLSIKVGKILYKLYIKK